MQNPAQILCTRQLPSLLIEKAADKKLLIDCIPFIEIKYIHNAALAQQVAIFAAEKKWVVFTSAHAVKAVASFITQPPAWRIASIGGTTKEQALQCFPSSALICTAKNASLLATKLLEQNIREEIIFFCGDQRMDDLPETLRSKNLQVTEVVVYNNIQTPHFIEKNYKAVLFFSPSAVHSFFSVNTLATSVVLFSIGMATTTAIKTYCTNHIITSEYPGAENLILLVIDFYKTKFY